MIGRTWDPFIDHTTFMPLATVDLMLLSPATLNVSLPFGTLLCNPANSALLTTVAKTPFRIPVPARCEFVGLKACAQGASADANNVLRLANALDITVGTL